MRAVARDLLDGERGLPREYGHELRYGRRGSLSVDPSRGVWHDFEAGVGGGTLDLVEHVRGCGRSDALAWLRDAGYLVRGAARPHRISARPPRRSERVSPAAGGSDVRQAARAALVASIWSAGEIDTARTPVGAYLRSRGVWIPGGYGCVRWLARGRAPAPVPEVRWFGLPRAAAGAALFAYERDGGWWRFRSKRSPAMGVGSRRGGAGCAVSRRVLVSLSVVSRGRSCTSRRGKSTRSPSRGVTRGRSLGQGALAGWRLAVCSWVATGRS